MREQGQSHAVRTSHSRMIRSRIKMKPSEKTKAFNIVEECEGFTDDCIFQVHQECHIPMSDMQHFQVCYECAKVSNHLEKDVLDQSKKLNNQEDSKNNDSDNIENSNQETQNGNKILDCCRRYEKS